MLATGRREGRTLIIAIVVLLFVLLAVVLWFRVPRRDVVPTTPPARVQVKIFDQVVAQACPTFLQAEPPPFATA